MTTFKNLVKDLDITFSRKAVVSEEPKIDWVERSKPDFSLSELKALITEATSGLNPNIFKTGPTNAEKQRIVKFIMIDERRLAAARGILKAYPEWALGDWSFHLALSQLCARAINLAKLVPTDSEIELVLMNAKDDKMVMGTLSGKLGGEFRVRYVQRNSEYVKAKEFKSFILSRTCPTFVCDGAHEMKLMICEDALESLAQKYKTSQVKLIHFDRDIDRWTGIMPLSIVCKKMYGSAPENSTPKDHIERMAKCVIEILEIGNLVDVKEYDEDEIYPSSEY